MTSEFAKRFLIRIAWIALGACFLYLVLSVCFALFLSHFSDRPIAVAVETEAIVMAMQQYKAQYGEYPAGDTRAIARALRGQNPQKIIFIQFHPEEVSLDGDLLDPWGTPLKKDLFLGK